MRADCIRVTHPYATLGQVLLLNLPFGLHVLGLPLAFILSQDQTLHSISSESLTSVINHFSSRPRSISIGESLHPISQTNSFNPWSHRFLLSFNSTSLLNHSLKNRLEYDIYLPYSGPLSIKHLFKERASNFSSNLRHFLRP